MPEGIQVLDPNGRVILDTNDSITRILGMVNVPRGQSGGVSLPGDQGRPWWIPMSRGASGYTALANVFYQNGTLYWNYDGVNLSLANDTYIVYGLY